MGTLSEEAIKQATPTHKKYKLIDSNNLYLEVRTNGKKVWVASYRTNKQFNRSYTIGEYPGIGLDMARKQTKNKKIVNKNANVSKQKSISTEQPKVPFFRRYNKWHILLILVSVVAGAIINFF